MYKCCAVGLGDWEIGDVVDKAKSPKLDTGAYNFLVSALGPNPLDEISTTLDTFNYLFLLRVACETFHHVSHL